MKTCDTCPSPHQCAQEGECIEAGFSGFSEANHLLADSAEEREALRRRPHKTMTPNEYAAQTIVGWHEVCRNVDGCGNVGVRYLGIAR